MSGVKHTPGPWNWVPSPHATHPDMGAFFSEGGQRVCWFGDAEQYYPSQGEPPSDADARLIAAAPDLLEALEGCIPQLELGNGEAEHIKAARAAIARARGEQDGGGE